MRWTDAQQAAISSRDSNVLVAAAAGSGKTAVLVERVLQMVTQGERSTDIDRLLVVTFTELAAHEMKRRIAEALAKALAGNPLDQRLRRQMLLLNRASISTLHAFCSRVLRRFFYVLDIDPEFRVIDAQEAQMARRDALERVYLRQLESPTAQQFKRLLERVGGSLEALTKAILPLYDFARSQPHPMEWLKDAACGMKSAWVEQNANTALFWIDAANRSLELACALSRRPDGPHVYAECLEGDCAMVRAAEEALQTLVAHEVCEDTWNSAVSSLNVKWQRLPAARQQSVLKEEAKRLRDSAKDSFAKAALVMGKTDWRRTLEEHATTIPDLEQIVSTLLLFDDEYSRQKAASGVLDFADLEQKCLEALSRDDVATEVSAQFDEVMVDECQDISPVQEAIIELVSRRRDESQSLYMVGDVKQSIYRFRLAEPRLFMRRYGRYTSNPHDDSPGLRLCLNTNFRSTERIIDAVNLLFGRLMKEGPAEIAYDEDARLVAHIPGGEVPEAYFIDLDETENDSDDEDYRENVEIEAQFVAERIAEMLGRNNAEPALVYDASEDRMRAVRESDIAVLLRATQNAAGVFWEQLRKQRIAAEAELDSSYFEASEVQVLLALLQAIDNPRQDIPLAAVLRSPIGGFDAADMADIRVHSPGAYFDALCKAAISRTELGEKCSAFLRRLDMWRTTARRLPVASLLESILEETKYDLIVRAGSEGRRRAANIAVLVERARQHDASGRPGLFRFLRFLERLRQSGEHLGSASSEDGLRGVRIMSVHKSKGLEFPVVFACGLGRKFNRRDAQREIMYHRELGLAISVCDTENRLKYPSVGYSAIADRTLQESLAEEIRVLYVALTRARQRLILTGVCSGLSRKLERWRSMAEDAPSHKDMLIANSFLDLLGPVLIGASAEVIQLTVCSTPEPSNSEHSTQLPVAASVEESFRQDADSYVDELRRRLKWNYPYRAMETIAAKLTASLAWRLSDGSEQLVESSLWPRPRRRRIYDPAEVGTAVHLVLQQIDLSRLLDSDDIEAQIVSMVMRGYISEKQSQMVDVSMLERFLRSPVGLMMRDSADTVEREVVFTMCVPAEDLHPTVRAKPGCTDGIIVQGVIDCLVRTAQGYVIIDYKTDNLSGAEAETHTARYLPQISLYARAVRELRDSPVASAYLCFLVPGTQIELSV